MGMRVGGSSFRFRLAFVPFAGRAAAPPRCLHFPPPIKHSKSPAKSAFSFAPYHLTPPSLPPPALFSIQETFGELKGQLDGPSFNILMTLVKEKMQALGPFAKNEFEELCAELGLEDKFRQVETQEAATVAAAQAVINAAEKKKAAAVAAALAAAAAAVSKKAVKAGERGSSGEELSSMTPEDLARHRRMVIKRKELAELQGMQERVRRCFWEKGW